MPSCRPVSRRRTSTLILGAAACWLFASVSLFAQGPQIFKGEVTQCNCAGSPSDAPCASACAQKGVTYVLSDPANKVAYQLDNQKLPKPFADRQVLVIGTLDKTAGTIHVADIVAAIPPKVMQAKSAYIDCDGCVRGMAKAKLAAFQQLTAWKRFTVVPDPHKADLVFLFSANPYLGDYITRDGPDKRLVKVERTYMNVVDPKTGESLWSDSEQLGSWFVEKATADMIAEFRYQLEEDQNPAERQLLIKRHLVPAASSDVGAVK
jgi:hypothetical protein